MIPSQLQPLANHLWQSTLFAAIAGLLTLALRQNRAQTRYWLWLAASVKFLIPFSLLVNVGSHWGRHAAPTITPPVLSYVIEQASQPFSVPTLPAATTVAPASSVVDWVPTVLGTIWAIGFAMLTCSWWRRWRGLRAALRMASPLDLQIGINVMMSPAFAEPGVFGLRSPVLLLPAGITDRLTPPQLKAIVAHECCHIRRCDNLAAAVHMGIEALFWFHPLVWWLGARLIEERERACDEEVLLMGSEPQVYAEGILNICELYLESPLPCMSGVTGANLRRRIERIMCKNIGARLSFARKTALIFAGATAIMGPVVVGVVDAPPIRAQVSPPTPANGRPGFDAFEVAAIKPTLPDWRGGRFIRMASAHEFVARNHALRTLVAAAYNVNPQAISGGPAWVDSAHYDITAKSPGEVRPNATQQMAMLRNLLADRFKLTLGHAQKDLPYYAIIEAKGGPKLKESPSEDAPPEGFPPLTFVITPELVRLPGHHASVADLASVLQRAALDRPVVDETGLAGLFDFTLEFTPDETVFGGAFKSANSGDLAKPGLFAAIQEQLGLKLEGTRGPVDVLVIEHVERPSEN